MRKVDKSHRQLIGVWLFVAVTDTVVILRRNRVGVGVARAKKADMPPLPVPTDIETLQNQSHAAQPQAPKTVENRSRCCVFQLDSSFSTKAECHRVVFGTLPAGRVVRAGLHFMLGRIRRLMTVEACLNHGIFRTLYL